MQHFSYRQFTDLKGLLEKKKSQSLSVGVAIPMLNEAETIADTIKVVRSLGELIDDVVVMDSESTDGSVEICSKLGVRVVSDVQAAKELGVELKGGKGFSLWASLSYLKTDIIIWIDLDIKNISKKFITGVLGPMILDGRINFVKGYYHRPKNDARVTEILVRPYLNLIFPELVDFIQPLSGEYGGRRNFLKSLDFYSGYSIEIALLIQARLFLPNDKIAQSFLGKRFHELQSVASLGRMSAGILRTLLELSKRYGRIEYKQSELPRLIKQFISEDGENFLPKSTLIKDSKIKNL